MKKKNLVYLAFGSNLGEKEQVIQHAYTLLEKELGSLIKRSTFFYSEAYGFESENSFVNSVCLFHTEKTAFETLEITQLIEFHLGRTSKSRKKRYEDRILDIDILLFNEETIDSPKLKIPHPEILQRDFVYIPLLEIAPKLLHPHFQQMIRELVKTKENSEL